MNPLPFEMWVPAIVLFLPVILILIPGFTVQTLREVWRKRQLRFQGRAGYLFMLVAGMLLCLALLYARRKVENYATHQFRYTYSILPFLLLPFLGVLSRLPKRVAGVILMLGILTAAVNSWRFAQITIEAFAPVTELVRKMKSQNLTDDTITREVVRLRDTQTIDGVTRKYYEIIYLGSTCHTYWKKPPPAPPASLQ
jgi:hypothetical protein